MNDDDEPVILIIILGSQYMTQKVSKALAKSTINSWVTGRMVKWLVFQESETELPYAACRVEYITGMHIAPATPPAIERMAAALEKQVEDGELWKG